MQTSKQTKRKPAQLPPGITRDYGRPKHPLRVWLESYAKEHGNSMRDANIWFKNCRGFINGSRKGFVALYGAAPDDLKSSFRDKRGLLGAK